MVSDHGLSSWERRMRVCVLWVSEHGSKKKYDDTLRLRQGLVEWIKASYSLKKPLGLSISKIYIQGHFGLHFAKIQVLQVGSMCYAAELFGAKSAQILLYIGCVFCDFMSQKSQVLIYVWKLRFCKSIVGILTSYSGWWFSLVTEIEMANLDNMQVVAEKLTKDNFHAWKFRITNFLKGKVIGITSAEQMKKPLKSLHGMQPLNKQSC